MIDQFGNIFEERAENLTQAELEEWTTLTAFDEKLLAKLKGPGAKLLIGPRGSGKSTLLKTAYYQLLGANNALPVYVNYAHSLALEPLFHTHANALKLFRQWVLAKVFVGVHETLQALQIGVPEVVTLRVTLSQSLIRTLEKGDEPEALNAISLSDTIALIEACAQAANRARAVLLMDDAAHAFSAEQQREFFEIYRQLRSRHVSSKAAIYPGITSFSYNFNVGHEAELLEAWYQPHDPSYLPLMREIARKRLPP